MRLSKGFTLLEVLVAMSIFAVIGLGANRMLRTIIDTHDITQEKIQQFSSFTRVFSVMERDFSQVVLRSVRDEYGEPLPPFAIGNGPYSVEFSRSGWNNPAGFPRSNIQRVAYELSDDNELIRYFWLVLDRAEDSEPIRQVLLEEVSEFQINVLDLEGDSTDIFPDIDSRSLLPVAAEVLLVTESLGEIRKVFAFVEAPTPSRKSNNSFGDGQDINDRQDSDTGNEVNDPNSSGQRDRQRQQNNDTASPGSNRQ